MGPDLSTRQARAAAIFMTHKGYSDARPFDVEKIEDQACWYFYYALSEGTLELEVYWDEVQWHTTVTMFTPAGSSSGAGR